MLVTDPILMFAVIMFILLLAPILFVRARMPGIIGLIAAGVVVGPYGLGILASEGAFDLFSSVGLIYIMFLAGLEINLHEFARQKKYSIVFGFLTFIVPLALGIVGGRYLFGLSLPVALLLASMFSSHTLISFPVASRLGLNRHRAVVASVGGTIITDTAAMLVLAVVAEWASGELTAIFWVRQITFLLLLMIFALWFLPRLTYTFFRIISPDGATEFVFVLAMVFLTSHLAHMAGVEPIIGAFFAGLALSRVISEQSPLMNRLEFVGNALFIPFFLVSVGMLVNIRVLLTQPGVWAFVLFMVVGVTIGKYLSAVIFVRIMKLTRDEGNLIFGLTVNQAAATLATVIVGVRLGLFDDAVLNGSIAMIMVTCMAGPLFTEKYGRAVAKSQSRILERTKITTGKVIVALSRMEASELLTDMALLVHGSDSQEPVLPLHVAQDGAGVDSRVDEGEKILGRMVARIVSADIPVLPLNRVDVTVSGGILHAVKDQRADVLILGVDKHRYGVESALFSVYDKVRDQSTQMILLCRVLHSLSIDDHLIVAVPPALECHPGFDQAMELVSNMVLRSRLALRIAAMDGTMDCVEKVLRRPSVKGRAATDRLNEWKDLPEYLKRLVKDEKTAILFMAPRKGQLGWQPSLERYYKMFCSVFDDNNIFLLNPSEYAEFVQENDNTSVVKTPSVSDAELLAQVREPLIMKGVAAEEAIHYLASALFPDRPDKSLELERRLVPFDPVVLAPKIVLLHTHTTEITESVIIYAINRDGFEFATLSDKSEILFVLVSPANETSIHLKALAKVARMARHLEINGA
jgi:Kef-type K+ transport system membrane component KefB